MADLFTIDYKTYGSKVYIHPVEWSNWREPRDTGRKLVFLGYSKTFAPVTVATGKCVVALTL